MFFIRNISISLLLFAFIFGAVFIALSAKVTYEAVASGAITDRAAIVDLTAHVFDIDDESASDAAFSPESLATLAATATETKGVRSFRVVDTITHRILASGDSTEVGQLYRDAPELKRGTTLIDTTSSAGSVIHITHLGAANRALWMVVETNYLVGTTIVVVALHTLLLIALFAVVGYTLYALQQRFVFKPLRRLYQSLSDIRKAQEGNKEGATEMPNDVGALLESFSNIADNIQATLNRDKLVSDMKSNFITTTAHQLRTPLSGINWALGALLAEKENLTEDQKSLIERSLAKIKELISIVGTLLNAASIEEGKFGYRFEELSIVDEVAGIVNEEQDLAQQATVTVVFNKPAEALPNVQVDKERIRWVIRNLIENAIRYSNEGGTVTVSITADAKVLTVSVQDTGIGIADEAQEKIFSKFFRSKEAVEKRDEGSGLGLYIAKNIVNRHGGKIWFDSKLGQGTTFHFTIPRGNHTAVEA